MKGKLGFSLVLVISLLLTAGCTTVEVPTVEIEGRPVPLFPMGGTRVTIVNGMPGGSPYYLEVVGKEMKPLHPGEEVVIRLRPSPFERRAREIAVRFLDQNGNHIETRKFRFRVRSEEFEERVWIVTTRRR